uniref:heavy-metal-associated domain-containing protein n=1 Tax=Flavobacterium sp. TaxID=239 RepID=UPI004049B18B
MRTTIKIQNLKCNGCASTIKNQLNEIADVRDVAVEVEENEISVDYSKTETLDLIKTKLEKIGYPEMGNANSVITKAKSYVSCAIGKMNT